MKSIIFSASILAGLASAAPLSQGTVNIKLELDAQALSATAFGIPFGKLFDASSTTVPHTRSIVCEKLPP